MNQNLQYMNIDTDRAIATILSNFSQEAIGDYIENSLNYKFRPFGNRMPNYPYILEQHFMSVKNNSSSEYHEMIENKRLETYQSILNIICEKYNLTILTDIPDELLYTIVYILYQVLISEFSDKLIEFFIFYLSLNKESLINNLTDEQKTVKSTYAKKTYNDPTNIIIYENIEAILDMIAGIDIDLRTYLTFVVGEATSNIVSSYISDLGNIFRNYLAIYINDPNTRIEMITSIKIRFAGDIKSDNNIINGNQFISDK